MRSLSMLVGASVLVLLACSTDIRLTSGGFVGSEKCNGCHAAEFTSWKDSYHSKMVRTPREGLLQDAADHWTRDTKGTAGPTKGNADGRPYTIEDVVLVVGTKWKQRYLVKNRSTGNHQFLDKQWNAYTRQWEGYGNSNDWETNCTTCHAAGYRLTSYEAAHPNTQSGAVEKNIGCETCHGSGARHVATGSRADIFNPRRASRGEADKSPLRRT